MAEKNNDLIIDELIGSSDITEQITEVPEFWNEFIVEAQEHLDAIESNVIEFEKNTSDKEIINALFRSFHTIKGLAGFVNQETIEKLAHQTETVMDMFRKNLISYSEELPEVILKSSDYIKNICANLNIVNDVNFKEDTDRHFINLENITLNKNNKTEEVLKNEIDKSKSEEPIIKESKIGEILVERGDLTKQDLNELLEIQAEKYPDEKLGVVAVKEKNVDPVEVAEAIKSQKEIKTAQTVQQIEYLKVPANKIDNLVDMLGELLITESLVEQENIRRFGSNDVFQANFSRMGRLTKELQAISMSLRMVSLKNTFQKLTRIIRDAMKELNKHNIDLEIEGEETEIDRNIADKLLDPLLHIVKNSISHGIETEDERSEKGKPKNGKVKVRAYSKRGNVYIEIIDDGKGINIEKVRNKAIEKGLAESNQNYSDEQIIDFIFLPGFSTIEASEVNKVSGRGVGMDVVRTEISKIGGKVDIINSVGKGCVFILKIPINLAAINGTIVEIDNEKYIIPTLYIKRIIRPEKDSWISMKNKKTMIKIREEVISLISRRKIFGVEDKLDDTSVIILEMEQKLKALPVDKVLERREIVVKPLGKEFSSLSFISGASILGDGKVCLILDIENIFRIDEE